MGLEPTTFCLGSKRSTAELHPQSDWDYMHLGGECQAPCCAVLVQSSKVPFVQS